MRGRLPVVGELLVVIGWVADDVDVADPRGLALDDGDGHIDAVAVELGHHRVDRKVVLAAVVVQTSQFLGHPIQAEPVEGLAFGEANLLEAFNEFLGLDVLVADEGQLVDPRPFLHRHHQDVALPIEADIVEKPGLEQGADRLAGLGAVDGVAFLDRQIGEHGAGRNALQAVDADVLHLEGFEALGTRHRRQREGRSQGKGKQAGGYGTRHRCIQLAAESGAAG